MRGLLFAMIELTFVITKPSTALGRSTTNAAFFTIQTETKEIIQTVENKAQLEQPGIHNIQCLLFFQGTDRSIDNVK